MSEQSRRCEFSECCAEATHVVKHHIMVSGVRCLAAEIPACLEHARFLVKTGFGDEIDGPVPGGVAV